MKVASLKGGVRRIWVEVPPEEEDGEIEKLWVDYRPGELTLEINDRIKEAVIDGFEADVAEIVLTPLIVDWDVDEDILNPDTNEPTGEIRHLLPMQGIKKVPLSFLGLVMQAIQDDAVPNAQRGATSADSSPQEEPQVVSPSGTGSSVQQIVSDAPPGSS